MPKAGCAALILGSRCRPDLPAGESASPPRAWDLPNPGEGRFGPVDSDGPFSSFPGTLTHRVPCMEKGRRASHVTTSNDTSWSAHHPLWLKLKQIKLLPVIKHLGGSSPPSVASSPEKPARLGPGKQAQPSCCLHLCFSPEELRDFALGFKKQNKAPTSHKDQCRYSPRSTLQAQRVRLEDNTDLKTKIFFYTF